MPARHEAGFLEGFSTCHVVDVAAGGRDAAAVVAGALDFLHQVGAQAAAALRFVHVHVEVAVGAVVVPEQAAGGGDFFCAASVPPSATRR